MDVSKGLIRELGDNKKIEVRPEGRTSMWVIHPHGLNMPKNLKEGRFTDYTQALKAVDAWLAELKTKTQNKAV